MKYLTYEEVKNLKVGDELVEIVYGDLMPFRVETEPVESTIDIYGEVARQLKFTATIHTNYVDLSRHSLYQYVVTEGYEHYGPKLRRTK